MMMHRVGLTFALVLVISFNSSVFAQQAVSGFEKLVGRIPDTANVLVLLDVKKILESPVAKREGWKEEHDLNHAAGIAIVPPEATKFVMGSQIDFQFMEPAWEIAMAELPKVPSIKAIAEKKASTVESIQGMPAVSLANDAYLIKFGTDVAGAMSPGNRQGVSRWLQKYRSSTSTSLSPYLTEAVGYTELVGTPIIMSLDLTDMIPATTIEQKLPNLETVKKYKVKSNELAPKLASIKGVTLGVTLGQQPFGALKIDFNEDISMAESYAKPLVLEILEKNGASIDEFSTWDFKVTNYQIALSGILTQSGMKRIFSMVNSPDTTAHTGAGDEENLEQKEMAKKTLAYFKAVQGYIRDLGIKWKDHKTMGQVSMWMSRYAQKIENLPVLGVDPEMLDYGFWVASQMRGSSGHITGNAQESRIKQFQAQGTGTGGWQEDGYRGYYDNGVAAFGRSYSYNGPSTVFWQNPGAAKDRRMARTEARMDSANTALTSYGSIQEATAQVRRNMTQKYQIEF